MPSGLGSAAVTERIVTDQYSGIAISGYDPVAYFSDHAAKVGRPEAEVSLDGVPWRFVNAGNRAAFVENPAVYMPRFGGHDPIAVARGAATAGNPELWIIFGERLYLFFNERAREEFSAAPDRAVAAAQARWNEVKGRLVD